MSYESHESLSAAMDGEVSSFELRRLIERLPEERALSEKWQRYHLAQQTLHNSTPAALTPEIDLVSRVRDALEDEESHHMTQTAVQDQPQVVGSDTNHWWKPFASMAVAASVTAVVILGGQRFTQDGVELPTAPANDPQLALNAPAPASSNLQRTQFGSDLSTDASVIRTSYEEPDVIRLSQGLKSYIDQHNQLISDSQPSWDAHWLPDGFTRIRHEVMPHAEIMVYSDGRHSVSVSIEPKGHQKVPAGVTQSGDVVAVGMNKGDQFVAVVGDVPLMIADRIAASVTQSQSQVH
jgi:sigma-E factor negative regulatory protein RseA